MHADKTAQILHLVEEAERVTEAESDEGNGRESERRDKVKRDSKGQKEANWWMSKRKRRGGREREKIITDNMREQGHAKIVIIILKKGQHLCKRFFIYSRFFLVFSGVRGGF